MSSLCFWCVYFALDAVYKVKAGFIMVLIRTVKHGNLPLSVNTWKTKSNTFTTQRESANILYETYKRVFCNNTKSLANKTTNFVNESHSLIWEKLQLGLTR